MSDLYMALGFIDQLRSLGFRVEGVRDPLHVRKRNYNATRYNFTVNGIGAWIEEKHEPHRLRYKGPIPTRKNSKALTFFRKELTAYEYDNEWTRTDNHGHINFP